ncbi:MAG TPA: hypothetical protein VI299_20860, partial [Polyangiales bacterium]
MLSATSLACSEPTPKAPAPAPPVETSRARTIDAPRELAKPAPQVPRAQVAVPTDGCVVELEQRVAPGARGVALVLAGSASLLIASDDALVLWQLGDGWHEGPRLALEAPLARASAVCS